MRRLLSSKAYVQAARAELGRSNLADVIPVCNVERKRARVSLGAIVSSYNKLKSEIDIESARFGGDATSPGRDHLHTELRWLIEDSVGHRADWSRLFALGRAESSATSTSRAESVDSRLSIEEIHRVWSYRLRERVPIQYILGLASWYDVELRVGEGVLIPRPETEVLLDLSLAALKANASLGRHPWLDLGTGSGALAIGMALHARDDSSLPVRVKAVEASPDAMAYARENVARYDLGETIDLVEGSWFDPFAEGDVRFGGIVSNPPYVKREDMADLQAEVRLHEPHSALCAVGPSPDGMDDLIRIVSQAPRYLVEGGFIGLETGGADQANALRDAMAATERGREEWRDVRVVPDLQGVDRFLVATRKAGE